MRACFLCCLLCLSLLQAFAQNGERPYWKYSIGGSRYDMPDTQIVMRMIDSARRYIVKPLELKADLDSAQSLLDKSMAISRYLNYNRGITGVINWQYQLSLERADMASVEAILAMMPPGQRMERYKTLALMSVTKGTPGSADTVFLYAQRFQEIARQNDWPDAANDAEFYMAFSRRLKGDVQGEKHHFLNMVAYHEGKGRPTAAVEAWLALADHIALSDAVYPTKNDCLQAVIALCNKMEFPYQKIWALRESGRHYFNMGRLDQAEHLLLDAEELAKVTGMTAVYQVYETLSSLYAVKANGLKAIYYGEAALENVRKVGNTPFNNKLYISRLAEVYYAFGRMDKYRQLLSSVKGFEDPQELTDFFYILLYSRVLFIEKGPAVAIDYLKGRIAKAPLENFTDAVRLNTVQAYFTEQGGLKNNALELYLGAERFADESHMNLSEWTKDMYAGIARLLYEKGSYDSTRMYLDRLVTKTAEVLPLYMQIDMYRLRYKTDSAQGRFDDALTSFGNYKALSDSLFNIEKMGQLAELDIKYETARKDQDLQQKVKDIFWLREEASLQKQLLEQSELNTVHEAQMKVQALQEARQRGEALKYRDENYKLLEKKWELQQTVISQALTTRKFIILGGVLLLLLLLVIYNRYLLKQRSNRQLKQQQEEITIKNESLQQLLREKEWLLKEVHHRVKNNLQVVMSLLNTQSHYLKDETAIAAIRDSQRRVNAISLIHKKLYQSDHPGVIDMQLYIRELLDNLWECSDDGQQIRFDINISPMEMDLSRAIPIGLILNEAVTNAFKYAFTSRQDGIIRVTMHRTPGNTITLTIADNGVGIGPRPEGRASSLGMTLMQGLCRDINAGFKVENQDGTVITIIFADETDPPEEQLYRLERSGAND